MFGVDDDLVVPDYTEKEVPEHVAVKLEQYKKTPRKRPDWASMMKEIEVGKQLRRVQTNDRSKPILPQAKAKGKVLPGQSFTPITCPDDTANDANTKEVVKQHLLCSPSLVLFSLQLKNKIISAI